VELKEGMVIALERMMGKGSMAPNRGNGGHHDGDPEIISNSLAKN